MWTEGSWIPFLFSSHRFDCDFWVFIDPDFPTWGVRNRNLAPEVGWGGLDLKKKKFDTVKQLGHHSQK